MRPEASHLGSLLRHSFDVLRRTRDSLAQPRAMALNLSVLRSCALLKIRTRRNAPELCSSGLVRTKATPGPN